MHLGRLRVGLERGVERPGERDQPEDRERDQHAEADPVEQLRPPVDCGCRDARRSDGTRAGSSVEVAIVTPPSPGGGRSRTRWPRRRAPRGRTAWTGRGVADPEVREALVVDVLQHRLVLKFGPPEVMMYIWSKTFSEAITCSTATRVVVRASSGIVMSGSAATARPRRSTTPRRARAGMSCRPARYRTKLKPSVHQTVAMASDGMAQVASPSQFGAVMPDRVQPPSAGCRAQACRSRSRSARSPRTAG